MNENAGPAEQSVAAPAAAETQPSLEALVNQFTKLTDYAERKAFYLKHPELQRVFSPINFHA